MLLDRRCPIYRGPSRIRHASKFCDKILRVQHLSRAELIFPEPIFQENSNFNWQRALGPNLLKSQYSNGYKHDSSNAESEEHIGGRFGRALNRQDFASIRQPIIISICRHHLWPSWRLVYQTQPVLSLIHI